MTDPFSMCVGIITIFGAARKVCNGLIVLKNAPREIEELRIALDSLTAVLDRVALTIQTTGKPESPNELLHLALDEATRVAGPLHSSLRELISGDEASLLRKGFDRVVWSRKRGVIKDYAVRLVNVKVSLIFALQAEQIFSSSRIETKLESVSQACATIASLKSKLYPEDANRCRELQTSLIATAPDSQQRSHIEVDFPQKHLGFEQTINNLASSERCNVSGIKKLLEHGAASPDDIKCDGGFTPLHYAIQADSLEACKFLIKAQGRPDLQTSASMTALDLAKAKLLTHVAEEETLGTLAELLKLPHGIESHRFSRVHEIVLGFRAESLTQALDQDFTYLDAPDASGRTPISWAAARGNQEAVSTLIDHLADIHLADTSSMTPFHYSATSNSLASLTLLLHAGADPLAKDKDRGWTPLHYAAFHQSDPSWVETLLLPHHHHSTTTTTTAPLNVNIQTANGKTPLVLALMKCHHLTAATLLHHGAAITTRGADGFTPLNSALLSNSTACMRVLLSAGISFDEVAWRGQTMLHLIAAFADEEMMLMLLQEECLVVRKKEEGGLEGLDVHAVDEEGLTAEEVLKRRDGVSAAVVRAFKRLCAEIAGDVDV